MAQRSTTLELFSRLLHPDATTTKTPDRLLVEEPLSIQLDGTLVSQSMPGPHDPDPSKSGDEQGGPWTYLELSS